MTGTLKIVTQDAVFVQTKDGSAVRFTFIFGFVQEHYEGETRYEGLKIIYKQEGCIGIWDSGKGFSWNPPLARFGFKFFRLATPSPDLYNAVTEALRSQGIIDKLKERVDNEGGRWSEEQNKKKKKGEPIEGAMPQGSYVIE